MLEPATAKGFPPFRRPMPFPYPVASYLRRPLSPPMLLRRRQPNSRPTIASYSVDSRNPLPTSNLTFSSGTILTSGHQRCDRKPHKTNSILVFVYFCLPFSVSNVF
ncbi:hypothetical protein L2E82_38060 [Cichorium intybus]|uniref:Uncharacterized protein n=1 Tax=Cichorium intybus TaxID=13427 RepID=A0ACB9AGQ3_CICIN|nr:hypothetical protein L2E82_38060 [Cichorium intybus]